MKDNQMKPKRTQAAMKLLAVMVMLGFACNGAWAQRSSDSNAPISYEQLIQRLGYLGNRGTEGGLHMDKQFTKTSNTTGFLTLDAYVTGSITVTEVTKPTDIVLVLDVSGSMDETLNTYSYSARTSQGYSYSDYGSSEYYYRYTDGGYYRVSRGGYRGNRNLSISVNGATYYLVGTGLQNTAPTGYNNNATIWTGVLYNRTTTGSQSKMTALKNAVKSFIDVVAEKATTEHVNHRISIIKYAGSSSTSGGQWRTGYYGSESSLAEGNHRNSGDSNKNYIEVVKNYRDLSVSGNAQELKTAMDEIVSGGATFADFGMTKSKYVLAQDQSNDRARVVVMFTDGEPNHGSGFTGSVANAAIAASNVDKNTYGATVWAVGVLGSSPSDNVNNYMNRLSSNYLDATTYQNGTQSDNKYYINATSADQLSNIFTAIAQESTVAPKELTETTIVQDVITPYFVIPEPEEGAEINCQVYKAPCASHGAANTGAGEDPNSTSYTGCNNGHYYDENGLHFGTRTDCTATVHVSQSDAGTTIQVTNFDYMDNWCGIDESSTSGVHGYKLIIVIPIEAKEGIWGDNLPTNTSLSVIYPEAGEDPIGHFPIPDFTIKVPTWVEHVYAQPENFDSTANPIQIKNEAELAWFISYVNGYNKQIAHPNANAIMMADVDMSGYNWVPIGSHVKVDNVVTGDGGQPSDWSATYPKGYVYTGTFDGNGHSIKGLANQPNTVYATGLFGVLYGATVKNVFVTDCDFFAGLIRPVTGVDGSGNPTYGAEPEGYFGIIADTISNGAKILNSEAAGKLRTWDVRSNTHAVVGARYEPSNCYLGGMVGLAGRDWVRNATTYAPIKASGTAKTASEVHSCMSVASLFGYKMGGLVCEVDESSKVTNSFSNVQMFDWNTMVQVEIGGLAAKNVGKIFNCYLLERETVTYSGTQYVDFPAQYGILALFDDYYTTNTTGKGTRAAVEGDWIAGLCIGNNAGSTSNLFIPAAWTESDGSSKYGLVGYTVDGENQVNTTAITNPFYFSEAETPYLYKHNDTRVYSIGSTTQSGRLLDTLNNWVKHPSEGFTENYTPWFRTTAADINGDYPVLKIADFECVASDSIVLHYGGINEMLSTTRQLSKTAAKTDDVICLYENAAVTEGNNSTTLYINEDVAITQTQNLNAYVGITLDNSKGAGVNSTHPYYQFDDDVIDWHMFSTSLSNAPLGVNYTDDTAWPFNYEPDTVTVNPMPEYSFYDDAANHGYFPSHVYGTTYGGENSDYYKYWDFYCWSEMYQHYINFKRNSNSHWKESADGYGISTQKIDYTNESTLVKGKGYMVATAQPTFLQCKGTLNNGNVTNNEITYTDNPFCVGYNLIGNPYQSYLDFDSLAKVNNLNSYAILDEDQSGYVTYTKGATSGPRYINMHQGFFVEVDASGSVTFNNNMRTISPKTGFSQVSFRGEEQAGCPWVKIVMTEQSGYRDYTTIEFDRPELGGGKKMKDLRLGDAIIYANYDGVGYSTFFATDDVTSVPVRFVTVADGTFTLTWEMGNARFGSLYLVDNINGQKIDMLSHNTYKFEGRASDYASRFKIVFELTEADEENEDQNEDSNFAFQMGDNLIVNGEGRFEMYDACGRLVMATSLYDVQNSVAVPEMARGIYVLRLAGDKSVKVQKIVVR